MDLFAGIQKAAQQDKKDLREWERRKKKEAREEKKKDKAALKKRYK